MTGMGPWSFSGGDILNDCGCKVRRPGGGIGEGQR